LTTLACRKTTCANLYKTKNTQKCTIKWVKHWNLNLLIKMQSPNHKFYKQWIGNQFSYLQARGHHMLNQFSEAQATLIIHNKHLRVGTTNMKLLVGHWSFHILIINLFVPHFRVETQTRLKVVITIICTNVIITIA
jgi:hypothetical protein